MENIIYADSPLAQYLEGELPEFHPSRPSHTPDRSLYSLSLLFTRILGGVEIVMCMRDSRHAIALVAYQSRRCVGEDAKVMSW